MPYCSQCGSEVPEDANFCSECGALISIRTTTTQPTSIPPSKPSKRDPLGAVSAGVFFILVAFTWINYPTLPLDVPAYFKSIAAYGYPVMLPPSLYEPIILFSMAFGIWLLILSGLRLIFKQNQREAAGNIAGGVFFLYLSYILRQYSYGLIAEDMVLPFVIVAIGILIAVGGLGLLIIHLATKKE